MLLTGTKNTIGIEVHAQVSEATPEEEPWKTALAKDLFEKYGGIPESYEDLGTESIRYM